MSRCSQIRLFPIFCQFHAVCSMFFVHFVAHLRCCRFSKRCAGVVLLPTYCFGVFCFPVSLRTVVSVVGFHCSIVTLQFKPFYFSHAYRTMLCECSPGVGARQPIIAIMCGVEQIRAPVAATTWISPISRSWWSQSLRRIRFAGSGQ